MNKNLTKTYLAGETLPPYRIVTLSDDNTAKIATDPKAGLLGVTDSLTIPEGKACDIHLLGMVEVEYGGTVTRLANLTTDANGKAVVAAQGDIIVAQALEAGVSGDIGKAVIR